MVRALGLWFLRSDQPSSLFDLLELREVKRGARIFVIFLSLWVLVCQLDGFRTVEIAAPNGKISMSKRDRERLEYLFRELIVYNSAGYTLLGSKPVSLDCVFKPLFKWDFLFLWHTYYPSNLKKYRAWKTWQKYESHFNRGDIQIWSEPSAWIENGELILIASKRNMTRAAQERPGEFPENIQMKEVVKSCLNQDDLLGILLGYGGNNAKLFHEGRFLKGIFSEEFHDLYDDSKTALNFTFGWPRMDISEILVYPMFMADTEAQESKDLKACYLKTRFEIIDYYRNKEFLEATFHLLAQ